MNKKVFASIVLGSCLSYLPLAHADASAALADYTQSARVLVQQLQSMQANAPSCGFIGRMVASRMANSIREQNAQINDVTAAVAQGAAGRAVIQRSIAEMNSGVEELRSNTEMIRSGLNNGNAQCQKARAAFEIMRPLTLAMPERLQNILSAM